MKKLFILTVLLFFVSAVSNRILSQEVVSSAGDHFTGNSIQVSWTLGEPVIETALNGQYILTQGMHQGNLIVTVARELEELSFKISAYPNPVSNYLKLDIDAPHTEGLSYALYSIDGQLLRSEKIIEPLTSIPMDKYTHSSYLLRVLSDDLEVKVFRVVKNQD